MALAPRQAVIPMDLNIQHRLKAEMVVVETKSGLSQLIPSLSSEVQTLMTLVLLVSFCLS